MPRILGNPEKVVAVWVDQIITLDSTDSPREAHRG